MTVRDKEIPYICPDCGHGRILVFTRSANPGGIVMLQCEQCGHILIATKQGSAPSPKVSR